MRISSPATCDALSRQPIQFTLLSQESFLDNASKLSYLKLQLAFFFFQEEKFKYPKVYFLKLTLVKNNKLKIIKYRHMVIIMQDKVN